MYQGPIYTSWSEEEDWSGRLLILKPLGLGAVIIRDSQKRKDAFGYWSNLECKLVVWSQDPYRSQESRAGM